MHMSTFHTLTMREMFLTLTARKWLIGLDLLPLVCEVDNKPLSYIQAFCISMHNCVLEVWFSLTFSKVQNLSGNPPTNMLPIKAAIWAHCISSGFLHSTIRLMEISSFPLSILKNHQTDWSNTNYTLFKSKSKPIFTYILNYYWLIHFCINLMTFQVTLVQLTISPSSSLNDRL